MAHRRFALAARLALLSALAAGSAGASDLYSYQIGLAGGIGGSPDGDPDPGLGNSAYQLSAGFVPEPDTMVSLRAGRIDFGDEAVGALGEVQLDYATVAGEYKLDEGYYRSGLFLGLGGYRLRGDDPFGVEQEETAIGLTLGVSGEFVITRRLAFIVELAGHYADLDEVQIFGTGLAGLALRF